MTQAAEILHIAANANGGPQLNAYDDIDAARDALES